MDLTRRLDQAVLPHLARALAWCLSGAARRRVVAGGAVGASAGLLVASVWAAHEPIQHDDAEAVVRVGLRQGQSVSAYAQEAGRELGDLADDTGRTYALVSFGAYVASDRLAKAISETSAFRVYARASTLYGEADVVEITVDPRSGDLRDGMREIADRRDRQARTYRRDAAKLTGGSRVERELRDGYLADAEAAAAEAAAYRSDCSCLFAAVVRGDPGQLGRLAEAPGVRTVDPAPEVTDLNRAVFLPPLPEDPDNVTRSSPPPSPTAPARSPSPEPSRSSDPPPSESPSEAPAPSGSASRSGSLPTTGDDRASSTGPGPDREAGVQPEV